MVLRGRGEPWRGYGVLIGSYIVSRTNGAKDGLGEGASGYECLKKVERVFGGH